MELFVLLGDIDNQLECLGVYESREAARAAEQGGQEIQRLRGRLQPAWKETFCGRRESFKSVGDDRETARKGRQTNSRSIALRLRQ